DGTVECAAPDKIIERGAVWQKFGGQSISQAMQCWENAEFAITPEVRRLSDDSPVAGLTLGLTGADGTQQSLATSASGATAVQNNINIDSLNASLLDKT
ncbi:type VI secretion system tip protein VgrG, partial [Enterobacter bugandensis]|nr:type VI secretion system tip protein VgrG [Enterobacter bugandensis]